MTEKRWVIVGVHGLYTGQTLTRSEAIREHIEALGVTWKYCRRKGDMAVKATIKYKGIIPMAKV